MRVNYSVFYLVCCLLFTEVQLKAHPSWGIAADRQGNIYFTDLFHHGRGAVWHLSPEGKLNLLLRDFHAHNLSLHVDGSLITAHGEMDEHYMLRLHTDGSIDTLIYATDYRQFNGGCCTYSAEGEIFFIADHYLWRINASGQREKFNEHYLSWSQSLYAAKGGSVIVPEIGEGQGKLIRLNKSREAEIIADNLISKLSRPYRRHADILLGISTDLYGHIYVAELAGQRIVRIAENGKSETFYTSEGDWFPSAINFVENEAFILEFRESGGLAGPRIVHLDQRGERSVLFDYEEYFKNQENTVWHPQHPHHPGRPPYWILSILSIAILSIVFWLFRQGRQTKMSSRP